MGPAAGAVRVQLDPRAGAVDGHELQLDPEHARCVVLLFRAPLTPAVDTSTRPTALTQLSFQSFSPHQLQLLAQPLVLSDDESEEDEDEDSEMETDTTSVHEESHPPSSNWSEPPPPHVPHFLPPFPGMERVDTAESTKRNREAKEVVPVVAEGPAKPAVQHHEGGNPWLELIPWSSSTMAAATTSSNPEELFPQLSPPPSPKRQRRLRSISPVLEPSSAAAPLLAIDGPVASTSALEPTPPAPQPRVPSTSLRSYRKTLDAIYALPPTYLHPSNARQAAASALSSLSTLFTTPDTLFGSIPLDRPRSALLHAGFLADDSPIKGDLHAFNSNLPHTISLPLPQTHSPHAPLVVQPPHARLPTLVQSLKSHFASPTYSNGQHLQLFSRMSRIGPPGPLNPSSGKTENYRFLGNTRLIALENTDVVGRYFNARELSDPDHPNNVAAREEEERLRLEKEEQERREKEGPPVLPVPAEDGSTAAAAPSLSASLSAGAGSERTGIKLSFGMRASADSSRVGSPVVAITAPPTRNPSLSGIAGDAMDVDPVPSPAAIPPPSVSSTTLDGSPSVSSAPDLPPAASGEPLPTPVTNLEMNSMMQMILDGGEADTSTLAIALGLDAPPPQGVNPTFDMHQQIDTDIFDQLPLAASTPLEPTPSIPAAELVQAVSSASALPAPLPAHLDLGNDDRSSTAPPAPGPASALAAHDTAATARATSLGAALPPPLPTAVAGMDGASGSGDFHQTAPKLEE